MDWGYFFAWCAVIFGLFFLTGWPVTPSLKGSWGNHYESKNLTYYAILYFHYFIGALFFAFLGLGLLRNVFWPVDKHGHNKQLGFLLAYSFLISSVFGIYGAHRLMPNEEKADENAVP